MKWEGHQAGGHSHLQKQNKINYDTSEGEAFSITVHVAVSVSAGKKREKL